MDARGFVVLFLGLTLCCSGSLDWGDEEGGEPDGDSDSDTDVDSDSDADGDTDSDTDSDTDTDSDADDPVDDADPEEDATDPIDADPVEPPPEGDCNNAADQAEMTGIDVEALLTTCGGRCLPGLTLVCIRACLDDETDLSDGCIECFVAYGSCLLTRCFGACFPEVESEACAACRAVNCDDAFEACTGLVAP